MHLHIALLLLSIIHSLLLLRITIHLRLLVSTLLLLAMFRVERFHVFPLSMCSLHFRLTPLNLLLELWIAGLSTLRLRLQHRASVSRVFLSL